MKKIFYTSVLFSIFLFQSCTLDIPGDGPIGRMFAIGSAVNINNTPSIITDDSTKIMLKNQTYPDSVVGKRICAEGIGYKGDNGFKYIIDVDPPKCYIVPIKEVQPVDNQSVIDSYNNADVTFGNGSVFQTGKYLNFFLNYFASEAEKHTFDFFINSKTENFEGNKVTVYFCHNNGGDNFPPTSYTSTLSLDLTSLFEKFNGDFEMKVVYSENSQRKEFIVKIANTATNMVY